MDVLNHQSLEQEIIAELDPAGLEAKKLPPVTVQRETVLAVLSRSSEVSTDFRELLDEAGLLAASALEMDYFGHVQIQRTGSLNVGWGSVAESNRNIDPTRSEIRRDASRSAFGYALEAGHPILITDIDAETRFRDPQLMFEKICEGAICPIVYRDQQYGALGVFGTGQVGLTKEDVLFLQSIALLLGPTRAHQKTERALAEHSRFLSSTIDALDAAVILLDSNGLIVQVNRACVHWGGFSADQIRGRKLWNAFFVPGESEAIRNAILDVTNGAGQRRCDAFFATKQGEKRRVSWTIDRLPVGSNEATFLVTGIDITEQYSAIAQLEELKLQLEEERNRQAHPQDSLDLSLSRDTGIGERRKHDRRPYSCVQSIAPCVEGKLPGRSDFREVRCHDISPRGFSFLLESKPNFNELVVAFGSPQSQLFLRAKVKHISAYRQEGRESLKIGCEYLGRVRLPWIAEKSMAS